MEPGVEAAREGTAEQELEALAAGPIDPPEHIPAKIFDAALQTFLDSRRLDMQALAADIGISRATLYRRVGDRERLLGEVLWYLTQIGLLQAFHATRDLSGPERIIGVAEHFMGAISPRPPLRHFLDAEPEAALRILTSKQGPVQGGVVNAWRLLIAAERERGSISPGIDDETLAYVMVRIGESFLYADVIADREPDVELALRVYRELLGAG